MALSGRKFEVILKMEKKGTEKIGSPYREVWVPDRNERKPKSDILVFHRKKAFHSLNLIRVSSNKVIVNVSTKNASRKKNFKTAGEERESYLC